MSMARRLGRGVIIPARAREAGYADWGLRRSNRPHPHAILTYCNTVYDV